MGSVKRLVWRSKNNWHRLLFRREKTGRKTIFVFVVFVLSIGISSLTVASDIPSLIKDLKDKDKAKDASYALAKIGKPAVPELIKALEGNNKNQKRYAARAIREMGQNGSDAIPALEKLLKDRDTGTREYVVEALGNMTQQANQVLPILEEARKDSNKDVNKKAKVAVEKLRNQLAEIEREKHFAEQKIKDAKSREEEIEEAKNYITQGYNYLNDKNYQEAKNVFMKSGKLMPSAEAFKGLGDAYYGLGDIENATQYYEYAIEKKPEKENSEIKTEAAKKLKELAEQVEQKKQDELRKQVESAEKGDAAVQYSFGLMYYNEKKNYNEAVKWLTKAAEQGHADSQFFLGQMYYKGDGVPENEYQAVKWLTKAAEQGRKDAQSILLEIRDVKETLNVKGFYIGMSLDKAVKLLNENYKYLLWDSEYWVSVSEGVTPPAEKPVRIKKHDYGNYYYYDHFISFTNEIIFGYFGSNLIRSDESGKVIYIDFCGATVNKLFNVKDMDGESFAQTFINNYSIPQLKPKISETFEVFWTYTSDKGFKVTIFADKRLLIEKVPRVEERKFD